jgi:hypothetical protein
MKRMAAEKEATENTRDGIKCSRMIKSRTVGGPDCHN